MNTKVYSFSTKSDKDRAAVQLLKAKANRTGISFSWLVVQAIKQAVENDNANT